MSDLRTLLDDAHNLKLRLFDLYPSNEKSPLSQYERRIIILHFRAHKRFERRRKNFLAGEFARPPVHSPVVVGQGATL